MTTAIAAQPERRWHATWQVELAFQGKEPGLDQLLLLRQSRIYHPLAMTRLVHFKVNTKYPRAQRQCKIKKESTQAKVALQCNVIVISYYDCISRFLASRSTFNCLDRSRKQDKRGARQDTNSRSARIPDNHAGTMALAVPCQCSAEL